jgi:multidrug efflux pump
MARFFIDRPIFAWVIAILIMLAGTLAIVTLPIAQYPAIAAPQISIRATYPGASAKAVEDTVTQVIEQQMNGLDGLRYMASTSEANGSANITLTFENGTDPDVACRCRTSCSWPRQCCRRRCSSRGCGSRNRRGTS